MIKAKYFLFFCVLVVFSCQTGKKDGTNQADVVMTEMGDIKENGLNKMQNSRAEVQIKMNGKDYLSVVTRTPDESLSKITNDMGDVYVDNKVVLTITTNGKTFFNKTFTKNDFASIVESSFLNKAILEGVVYNRTDAKGILYAASVCYPQTDLYIPISILISPIGTMTIRKDELLEDIYEPEGM